ncbi:LysR family transcriptional regulator [Parasedimentitalea marina]|uniref:LysR family transcriptional regulator n=1 Tax=Parasedimentitalea marina TaxID=2483033 RepID=A0A3T0N0B3_9RHOB|nr:LysR family transcriptional regulator [Parasedimentitalea marina]AZV77460.1 LysR family transcriptional regulator [Parasedimentitalea marina]
MDWTRVPSLAALRAFESAARCQSFSKAARELNVTHAAIAHHVRGLEAEFSESLIIRQGRGVAVTAAGLQLAESLQAGFSTIASGVERLRSQSENRSLNITVTPAFAANWLMPRIGEFWAKHPEISLTINPSIGLTDLRKDGFDLAIRYGDGGWPNVKSELLTDGDFWVVAHPDLVKGRTVRCLQDVVGLPWLMESHMMERKAIVEREGIDFEQIDLTLLNTNGLVLSAVAAGLGISVQPKSIVERDVQARELVKICELNQENLGYYMVMLPDRDPKGLRAFRSWLRTKAA